MNRLFEQILRFGIIGIYNTLIDFGLFNLFVAITGIHSGWKVGLLNMIAVMAAMTNSYIMNRTWTFRSDGKYDGVMLGKFVLCSSIGMLINSLVVTGISGLSYYLPVSVYLILNTGKLMGAVFSSVWNFVSYRKWVFGSGHADKLCEGDTSFVPGMLSIVIPAYNEALRIPERLRSLADAGREHSNLEIIVVNDGSKDNTQEVVEQIALDYPCIRCISYAQNQGKGYAVRTGMLHSHGEHRIFADADQTFSWEHIKKVYEELKFGKEVAIGARFKSGQARLDGESWVRRLMGTAFYSIVQWLFMPDCPDSQCGLKGFSHQAANQIFQLQSVSGFAFDVEILSLAKNLKYDVAYVPVTATDCAGSSVNRLLSPLAMARDLVRIKFQLGFNYYGMAENQFSIVNLFVGCALFMTALAVRIPWLWQFPRFIDELKEVNLAYSIYWGQALPLHNAAHDIGSMHNYILAAIFKLFGPSIYWPRLYVAVTSALTVVLIYRLGCKLFDKWTGLLAAGFLLTNGMHIMVTHMAWANCTTPFFFTFAMLAMVNAEKKKSSGWLIAAAFLWAAALQTHSSVIIYVLVALVYVFSRSFRKTTQMKASSYFAAAIVFIISYANMIYYNIASKGGSLTWLTRKRYALEHDPGLQAFFINLQNMIVEMIRSISSTYQFESHVLSYLLHPAFLAVLVLVITGAVLAFKKGDRLLIWMIIGGLAIIPWINHRYDFYLATRYVMPLILCSILLMSYSIIKLVKTLSLHSLQSKWVQYASGGVMAMLVVLQIIPFYNYCSRNQSTNLSNKMALQVMSIIQKENGSHMVLMDANIDIENRPIPYLLRISNEKFVTISSNEKDQFKGSVAAWNKAIHTAGAEHLYAILTQSSYMAIKNDLEGAKTYELKSKIVIPSPKTELRKIYVVQLNNSHLLKNTAKRRPNPVKPKADYILSNL